MEERRRTEDTNARRLVIHQYKFELKRTESFV